ncbi:AAA family ATPase [Nocardia anaemiae]|uniref:AAA family ATPase n=1 Tax=Nocardia anaemiae TaxID=263910 RepID=UPI0007A40AC0|nr:AAA family ATPase [Nocardia anaemiae]
MTQRAKDKLLVLVNGLPGSGKSTLAALLARELDAQLLSKDTVKEALAEYISRPENVPSLGAIAMEAVWAMATAIPQTVVIDSWWFRPRDLEFARAGIHRVGADRAIEIWCDASVGTARARYARRQRAAVHNDGLRLARDWDKWAAHGRPLELTPVIRVDTTKPTNAVRLGDEIGMVAASVHAAGAGQSSAHTR